MAFLSLARADSVGEEVEVEDLSIIVEDFLASSKGVVAVRVRDGENVALEPEMSAKFERIIGITAQAFPSGGSAIHWSQAGREYIFQSPLSPAILSELAGLVVEANEYRLVVGIVQPVGATVERIKARREEFWRQVRSRHEVPDGKQFSVQLRRGRALLVERTLDLAE